jgi:hypothetical protein
MAGSFTRLRRLGEKEEHADAGTELRQRDYIFFAPYLAERSTIEAFLRAMPTETTLFFFTAQPIPSWIHPLLPKASSMIACNRFTTSSDGVL